MVVVGTRALDINLKTDYYKVNQEPFIVPARLDLYEDTLSNSNITVTMIQKVDLPKCTNFMDNQD